MPEDLASDNGNRDNSGDTGKGGNKGDTEQSDSDDNDGDNNNDSNENESDDEASSTDSADESSSDDDSEESDNGTGNDEGTAESPGEGHQIALAAVPTTPTPNRALARRRRANSIDGIFVLDDDDPRITPRRVLSEVPDNYFPAGAVNGALVNLLDHTVAYQRAEEGPGIDTQREIVSLGSDAGDGESEESEGPAEPEDPSLATLSSLLVTLSAPLPAISVPLPPLSAPSPTLSTPPPTLSAPPLTLSAPPPTLSAPLPACLSIAVRQKRPAEEPAPEGPLPKCGAPLTSSPLAPPVSPLGALARLAPQAPQPSSGAHVPPTPADAPALAAPVTPLLPEPSGLPVGVNYDGLNCLELDLIPTSHGLPFSLYHDRGIAIELYNEFNDPERIVLALQLLATLSSDEDPGTTMAVPAGIVMNLVRTSIDPIARMIDASRRAQSHLGNSEKSLALLRMKTLMSYITLFLTLEHVVVPKLREEKPDWTPRQIESDKYRYFQQLLASSPDSPQSTAPTRAFTHSATNTIDQAPAPAYVVEPPASLYKLRDHIGYGRVFWSFGQELGIASLLMFAVSAYGLTKIAKQCGPRSGQIATMASALSSSQTWWAFAHGIGPRVIRTLFGSRDVTYTVPQLLQFVRSEPIPTTTMGEIHKVCREMNLETDVQLAANEPEPALSALTIFVGNSPIPVKYHPNGNLGLAGEQVQRRNLAEWLVNTPDTMVVRDASGQEIPFHVFKTLLPPTQICPELVEFFCRLYNRKAIPGRMALSGSFFRKLPKNGITFLELLDTISNVSGSPDCNLLICALDLKTAMIAIIFRRGMPSVEVYNWLADENLKQEITEVFEVNHALQISYTIIIHADSPVTGISNDVPRGGMGIVRGFDPPGGNGQREPTFDPPMPRVLATRNYGLQGLHETQGIQGKDVG